MIFYIYNGFKVGFAIHVCNLDHGIVTIYRYYMIMVDSVAYSNGLLSNIDTNIVHNNNDDFAVPTSIYKSCQTVVHKFFNLRWYI